MTAPLPPTPAPVPAAPAPGAAPAAPVPAGEAPSAGTGQSATDAAGMDEVAWQIAAEADAKYSIVAEPGGGDTEQAPAPSTGQTVG